MTVSMYQLFKITKPAIIVLSPTSLKQYTPIQQQQISQILDKMGKGSQLAQKLPTQITNINFIKQQNHIVILLVNETEAVGIHKIGIKHLFQYDSNGVAREMDAFCCLDFYVLEQYQRNGLGKLLFEVAENVFQIKAQFWAFDKPSPKLFAFLLKHYKLNVKSNFDVQVSKFAMSQEAILINSQSFSRIKTDSKLKKIDNYDQLSYIQEESAGKQKMSILKQYLPKEIQIKPNNDYFSKHSVQLEKMTLDDYQKHFDVQTQNVKRSCVEDVEVEKQQTNLQNSDITVQQLCSKKGVADHHKKTSFW